MVRVYIRSAVAALVAGCACSVGLAQNLLVNPSFETGSLAPWTTLASSVALATYGTAGLPGQAVSATIGGGGLMLRDGGNGVVEQVLAPTSIPAGSSIIVEGYFGGSDADEARLVVRFLNAAGVEIGQDAAPSVTPPSRNFEDVLRYRRLVAPVPLAATRIAVRIEFRDLGYGGPRGAADALSARLVTGSTVPPAVPMHTELLNDPGFEGGWIAGSPLSLTDPRGWEGGGSSQCLVRPYADGSPLVPPGIVSCLIDGAAPYPSCGSGSAGNVLAHGGNNAILRQWIDVRGNGAQFAAGTAVAQLSAFLGGMGSEPDTAQVDLLCIGANGTVLRSVQLAPVTNAARNQESVLVRRQQVSVVPAATQYFEVRVTMSDTAYNGPLALADNVSLQLVAPVAAPPVPLNTNLVANGSLEDGSLPGSPLELTNALGWSGQGARCATLSYGSAIAPPTAFASLHALGAQLLVDGGNSSLRQAIDLRGSRSLIQAGRLAFEASAWLGGFQAEPDTAEVRIHFENAAGLTVGVPQLLPPVTNAQRQNQTTLLLRRSGPFAAPATAERVVLELVCFDTAYAGPRGLADDIRLVAFDVTQQSSASPYPGTPGADFVMLSGVNELPRTGLGHYVKAAVTGDVLQVRVGSPGGSLDGMPLVLAANLFPTGLPPAPSVLLPGLALDPTKAFLLLNGLGGGVFSPVVIPLAQGGSVWSMRMPPALDGMSILLQALAFPLGGTVPPNGIFFASEGHEIR